MNVKTSVTLASTENNNGQSPSKCQGLTKSEQNLLVFTRRSSSFHTQIIHEHHPLISEVVDWGDPMPMVATLGKQYNQDLGYHDDKWCLSNKIGHLILGAATSKPEASFVNISIQRLQGILCGFQILTRSKSHNSESCWKCADALVIPATKTTNKQRKPKEMRCSVQHSLTFLS